MEYPAYGVTGPGKDTSPTSGGDRKLAQNAQLYHYQHQKQQMMAFDNDNNSRNGGNVSDNESDGDEDYTVFECPGLAPVRGDRECVTIALIHMYFRPVRWRCAIPCSTMT